MEKVLIVDDEIDILNTVKRYLRDDYDILLADNAHKALEIYKSKKPKVIVTDIRMPGMNGIELMRQVKAMDGDAEVIVITGHGTVDTAVEALRLGAVDFILKPVDLDRLDGAIMRALGKLRKKDDVLNYIEGLLEK